MVLYSQPWIDSASVPLCWRGVCQESVFSDAGKVHSDPEVIAQVASPSVSHQNKESSGSSGVKPTASVDSTGTPAKAKIASQWDDRFGYFTTYQYQIQDKDGNSLQGDGYTAKENVILLFHSGDETMPTPEPHYVRAPSGIITDVVGLDGYNSALPKNSIDIFRQTIDVKYQGHAYPLSTTILHTIVVKNSEVIQKDAQIINP